MAEFLEDPSVLTKDKLKNELAANNVALPTGEHKKEVYVQLYLKNLTVLNNKKSPPADTFSSDDELPAPVVSNRSRSGRVSLIQTIRDRIWFADDCDAMLYACMDYYQVRAVTFVVDWNLLFLQKATKKTDKPRTEDVDVTDLSDEDLKQQLAKHGVDSGPIVGTFLETRLFLLKKKNNSSIYVWWYKTFVGAMYWKVI